MFIWNVVCPSLTLYSTIRCQLEPNRRANDPDTMLYQGHKCGLRLALWLSHKLLVKPELGMLRRGTISGISRFPRHLLIVH
jgi:hypothetical protein